MLCRPFSILSIKSPPPEASQVFLLLEAFWHLPPYPSLLAVFSRRSPQPTYLPTYPPTPSAAIIHNCHAIICLIPPPPPPPPTPRSFSFRASEQSFLGTGETRRRHDGRKLRPIIFDLASKRVSLLTRASAMTVAPPSASAPGSVSGTLLPGKVRCDRHSLLLIGRPLSLGHQRRRLWRWHII